MKKLFTFIVLICILALLLSSCGYKQNEWISEEKLSKCLIPDFPEIQDNYVVKGDGDIYVKFSEEEYKAYVSGVYEYLKSKNFEYLGTRGELQSSLSGAFNTYLFKPADILEDFYVDGAYRFVYSDGKVEELDDTFRFRILTINTIGLNTIKTIEEDGVVFKYNTVISVSYNSEYPLSGRYVLPEPEHEHTGEWGRNNSIHFYQYTCGCPSPDIAELHIDWDVDMLCDVCGYNISNDIVENCTFNELFNISDFMDVSNLSSVLVDRYDGLLGSPTMNDVSISTDREYINSVIDFINSASFTPATECYDGVGAYSITLFADGKSFEFSFTTRNEFYVNNVCYNSSVTFPLTGRFEESYGYINPWNEFYLSSYGNTVSLADFDLSEIHLRGFEVDFYAYDYTKDADLIVDGEIIKIISAKSIYWEGRGWYEVISEKDFGSLIPTGETESEIIFVNGDNEEIGRVFVSNNVTYTLDEIKDIASELTYGFAFEILNSDGTAFVDRAFAENETIIVKYLPRC